ncbi:chitinase-3-like protein 1 [Lasioglossum baleicum]|uniref:chitinase-3-like protein 1 n=1 Tax=Lasioglossum baleicum TaxID=434251 RepID=UPI003FCD50D4
MFKVALLVAFMATMAANVQAEKKIVCYFGSWTVYRPGNGQIAIEDINPRLCTHMIYSFIGINTDGTVRILDAWADLADGGGKNGFGKFTSLAKQNDVKALIAIGGWNEGSTKFSQVVSNPQTRSRLVQDVVSFLQRYNFDGFDVDWEYPNQRGGQPSDKENFVALLRELRQAFDSRGYILSVAVGAAEKSASQSYIINQVGQYAHLINLMTYDMNGSWNKVTGINAPLYASDSEQGEQAKLNVDASVRYWLSNGAPADKLIVGIPSYGRTFTLANPSNNGVGAPATGPGNAGPYTREAGMLGYNEICESVSQGGWTIRREDQQRVPYAVKGNQWVGYDDVDSVREKCDYITSRNLGGAMMWSIETDDFRGICGLKYPLLTKMNEVLRGIVPQPPNPPPNPPPTPKPTPAPPGPPPSGLCNKEGYVRDPNDCSIFYYCQNVQGQWKMIQFHCPAGTAFDPSIVACNYKDNVPGC